MAESITLQTSDSDVISSDVLGRVSFAASSESSGSDAILIGASIYAMAESDFTAISNATSLVFATANSESAIARLKVNNQGHFLPIVDKSYDIGSNNFMFRNIYGDSGIFSSILTLNNVPVSISGHSHSSSDITNFNSSVSGLLPVKDIIAGTGISVSSTTGVYTINSTGSGVLSDRSKSIVTTVFNKTGNQIPKMTAVYIDGGQGDIPTIQKAIATTDMTSAGTYGLTYENIDNMTTGQVIVFGALTGLNTDQFNPTAPQGNINGKVLYLSPITSGVLTTTKPSAPDHIVAIGTVVRTHQNEGVIEVRVQNGFELEELHNVAISGVTNGQFLQYNSASGLWLASSSGNFSTLQLNGTSVSISGHIHSSSDITNFHSSVSGLLPVTNIVAGTNITVSNSAGSFTINSTAAGGGGATISNSGANRLLVNDGSTSGIVGQANLTFNGSLLNVTGSGLFSSGLNLSDQTANTIAGFDSNKNVISLLTTTYPSLTELSYVKGVTSALQTQLGNKSDTSHVHGNITNAGAIGSAANLPLITTTAGAITVGSFGTAANTFCQGNDSRLSDARTPISHTHASSDITNFNSSVSGLLTKTISFFTAANNQPPATNFATLDTRNSISVLEFDANTQESAIFVGVMPDNVVLTNGLTVRLWWMGDTATTGNVRWGVSFEKVGTDNDADSFDSVTQATGAANGTSGIETVTSITATAIDSLVAGDRFRLKITRIADDATNDTMLGDAQLVAVEVRAA